MFEKYINDKKIIRNLTIASASLWLLIITGFAGIFTYKLVKEKYHADAYCEDCYYEKIEEDRINLEGLMSEPVSRLRKSFSGNGFLPEGPEGDDMNIPAGYLDRDYQRVNYTKEKLQDLAMNSSEQLLSPDHEEEKAKDSVKIVSRGYISLKVSSVSNSIEKIQKLLGDLGGIMISQRTEKDRNNSLKGSLKVLVDAKSIETFFKELEAIGDTREKNISYENITKQYSDTAMKIQNKKTLRNSYLGLLNKPNLKIDEILKIKKELNDITGEIHDLEDRKKSFDDWLLKSPVNIELTERSYIDRRESGGIFKTLLSGLVKAWYLFFDTISFLITAVGLIVPVGLVFYLVYRIYKKYRKEK